MASRSGTTHSGAAGTRVTFTGPFFERDVAKTFRQNVRAMLEGMAREGEGAVKSAYPIRTGAGREGVRGRVASLSGKPWALTMVVSETHVYPWPGAGAKQYRGGRTEARVHMFRRTAQALKRARAIAIADLTKGMS